MAGQTEEIQQHTSGDAVNSFFSRDAFKILSRSSLFNLVSFLHIVANSMLLVAETSAASESNNKLFFMVDIYFTVFFATECVIKVYALGFFNSDPECYLRDSWNRLDFVVVLFAMVNFIPGMVCSF